LAGWDDETCGGGGGRGGGTGGVVVRGGGCMRPPYLELPVLPPEVPLRKRWERLRQASCLSPCYRKDKIR
jgi:hypothetical protein